MARVKHLLKSFERLCFFCLPSCFLALDIVLSASGAISKSSVCFINFFELAFGELSDLGRRISEVIVMERVCEFSVGRLNVRV
jgi:hypothetical protein